MPRGQGFKLDGAMSIARCARGLVARVPNPRHTAISQARNDRTLVNKGQDTRPKGQDPRPKADSPEVFWASPRRYSPAHLHCSRKHVNPVRLWSLATGARPEAGGSQASSTWPASADDSAIGSARQQEGFGGGACGSPTAFHQNSAIALPGESTKAWASGFASWPLHIHCPIQVEAELC